MSKIAVTKYFKHEGYAKERKTTDYVTRFCIMGLKYKEDSSVVTEELQPPVEEVVHHHCIICKATPCSGFDEKGNPLCKECKEAEK